MTHKERAKALVAQMTLAEKCAQLRHEAPAIERLGIPAYNWWNEGLHGVARSGVATVFPQAIAMAASFDDSLLKTVADAISDEARAKYNQYKAFGDTGYYQGLTYWSPNINIFRDPRWGRGHETYGEDPYLTGRMGTAFVRGLQGDDPKYRKLDATLKHYAVHSGPEPDRHTFDARVSKKDMYETYLAAFRTCVRDADPSSVMGSYNRVNGVPACASKELLQDILREEFGFNGYVVSDCGAINDIHAHHHYTKNAMESAAAAVKAGCELNCGGAYAALVAAVAAGLIDEETITAAAERLFEARFRLGMFDDDCPYDSIDYDVVDCPAHRELNRKMAREGVVLLKNNGILPLANDGSLKIAVIGPNADEKSVLLGNYNGTPFDYTTIFAGLKKKAAGKLYYAFGCDHVREENPQSCAEHPMREAIIAARHADVVVMCMGLTPGMEGEEGDSYNFTVGGDKPGISLPDVQNKLLEAIRAEGKPIIWVNVSGSAIDLRLQDACCDAVIQQFYGGAEMGDVLAEILFGETNPSGRLPVTFYRSNEDLPAFNDYAMEGHTYRYFRGEALYPFGYGLSYTEFAYGETLTEQNENGYTVRCTVKNIGGRTGDAVAQIYYRQLTAAEDAPIRQLCGFERISLEPGEEKEVVFTLSREEVYMVNNNGEYIPCEAEFSVQSDSEKAFSDR